MLERTEVLKVEKGRNKATGDRVRAGFAVAFGLSREEFDAFLYERATLRETLTLVAARHNAKLTRKMAEQWAADHERAAVAAMRSLGEAG